MILVIDNYDSFTFNLVQYLEMLGARSRWRGIRFLRIPLGVRSWCRMDTSTEPATTYLSAPAIPPSYSMANPLAEPMGCAFRQPPIRVRRQAVPNYSGN